MRSPTYSNPTHRPGVVRLRTGRLVAVAVLLLLLAGAGALWLLARQAKPINNVPLETTVHVPWMKQTLSYLPTDELLPRVAAATPPPPQSPELLQEIASLRTESQQQKQALAALSEQAKAQQEALNALQRGPRPGPMPVAPPPPPPKAAAPTPPPPKRPPGGMLFVTHDLKEVPPVSRVPEYTLAPGGKIPFVLETKIISDVEGYLTGRVTTNVYDSATGRHLLVPQGSTILGNTQSSKLVYGNERLDTITLTLALPDGRSIDLERAPITDQEGVSGLGGDVNAHYGRLLAAVLIQGVLRGGTAAITTAVSSAAGAGQVASGVAGVGAQTATTVTGPLLSTKPTITTEAGQLANIILLQPLKLQAMWQDGEPHESVQAKKR